MPYAPVLRSYSRTIMKYQIAFAALIAAASTAGGQVSHADHGALARPASATSPNGVIVRRDGIRTVTVTATDYSFAAPDTIPAGLTELRLLNRGTEMHHAMLVRLDAGKTMADLFAAMQSEGCLLYTSDAADERSSVDLG